VGPGGLREWIRSALSAVGSQCPPPARSDHGLLSAIRSDEATMNDVHYLRSVGCSRTPNINVQRGSLTEIANSLHRIVRRGVPAPQIGYWIHDSFTALEWRLLRRCLLCNTQQLLVSPKRASQ